MEGAGAHFHIIGLLNNTSLFRPILTQFKDDILKIHKEFLKVDQPLVKVWYKILDMVSFDCMSCNDARSI
jgi:hypothetical protein